MRNSRAIHAWLPREKPIPGLPKARNKTGKKTLVKIGICLPRPNPRNSWRGREPELPFPCTTRILECCRFQFQRHAGNSSWGNSRIPSLSQVFLTFCAWAGSVRTRVKSPRQISSCWGVPLQIWGEKSKLQMNSRWDWSTGIPGSPGNLRHPGVPGVCFSWKNAPRRFCCSFFRGSSPRGNKPQKSGRGSLCQVLLLPFPGENIP